MGTDIIQLGKMVRDRKARIKDIDEKIDSFEEEKEYIIAQIETLETLMEQIKNQEEGE